MKKLFTFFLVLVASIGTMFAWDYERVQIGDLYYNLDTESKTAEVTSQNSSYPKWSTTITTANIPASVEYNSVTYSVTSIGSEAFYGCRSLISIKIPNSVTSIGGYAFLGCSNLTSIEIPNSVTSIGSSAFYECSGLTSPIYNAHVFAFMPTSYSGAYTIPEGIESIAGYAFSNCSNLTSIEIPNTITSIGNGAFSSCIGLTSIEIPNSVTSIGDEAFRACIGLTSIEIPNSVTSIGRYAFARCLSLTFVTIGNSVTSIGEWAFAGCNSLPIENNLRYADTYLVEAIDKSLSSYTIKDGTKWIGRSAFSVCSSLISIKIPNSVTSIGGSAFRGCSNLTSIEISNSITSIEDSVFHDCSSLTSVTIPNSVTRIGSDAFYGCSGLTTIVVQNGNSAYDSRDNCNALIETISNTLIVGCQNTVIPNTITSIGNGAFSSCTGLTSIEIPNSVTSIGDEAFRACIGLTSITCEAVTPPTLGYEVFYGIDKSIPLYVPGASINAYKSADQWKEFTNIQAIHGTEPCILASGTCGAQGDNLTWELSCDSILTISGSGEMQHAYYATSWWPNSSIKSVVIEEGATNIASEAFFECSSLTSIEIPNSVTSLGDSVFMRCRSLISIEIPNSVTSIRHHAFEDCTSLTSIEIPSSVTSIRDGAFRGCNALTSIVVQNGNSVYDSRDNCNALIETISNTLIVGCQNTVIPNTITSIGNEAFFSCIGLSSIDIPNSVTSIGERAFSWCTGLTSITCKAVTPPKLGYEVFYGVDKSIPLYVHYNSLEAYKSADQWKEFTRILPIEGYPVIFLDYNSEILSEQYVKYGMAAEAPEVPKREGYTFVGWNVNFDRIIAPTYAIALYDKIGGTLTYLSEEGDVIATENVDLHLPEAPAIEGKSFKGWLTESADFENGIVLRATYTFDNPTTHDDVTITPSSNSAAVIFPFITGALTYQLVIRDLFGNVVCKIMFSATGHLLGIAFAPSRNRESQQATQTTGFNFTVEGLDANTTYEYEFVANDDTDEVIETLSGSFTTKAENPTDNEQVNTPPAVRKYLEDGHLMINANARFFDSQGKMVR